MIINKIKKSLVQTGQLGKFTELFDIKDCHTEEDFLTDLKEKVRVAKNHQLKLLTNVLNDRPTKEFEFDSVMLRELKGIYSTIRLMTLKEFCNIPVVTASTQSSMIST